MGFFGRPLRPSPADHVLYLLLLGSRQNSPLLSSLSSLHAHLGQHKVSTDFLRPLSCGAAFRVPGRIHLPGLGSPPPSTGSGATISGPRVSQTCPFTTWREGRAAGRRFLAPECRKPARQGLGPTNGQRGDDFWSQSVANLPVYDAARRTGSGATFFSAETSQTCPSRFGSCQRAAGRRSSRQKRRPAARDEPHTTTPRAARGGPGRRVRR